MARWFYAIATVLLLGFHTMVPASASWASDQITRVHDRVANINTWTFSIHSWTKDLKGQVNDMKGSFDDGRDAVRTGTPIRDLIDAARDGINQVVENEGDALDEFLSGDEPEKVREQLRQLIRCAADLANTQLKLSFSADIPCFDGLPDLTFQKLIDLVDAAPDIALYPFYRAKAFLDPVLELVVPLLECAKEHSEELFGLLESFENDDVDYEMLFTDAETMDELRALSRVLKTTATVTQMFGKLVDASAEFFDIDFEAAIWGWVGGSIDSNPIPGVRSAVESVLPYVDKLTKLIDRHVLRAETASYRSAVLANQKRILELLDPPRSQRRLRRR